MSRSSVRTNCFTEGIWPVYRGNILEKQLPTPRHVTSNRPRVFGTSFPDSCPIVCTPLLVEPDTVQVLHSQINLLRETVLDMRQSEAQEITDLRRQVDSLEKSVQGNAKARLDEMESRLETMEQQPRGSGMVRG